jgi:hypothetical protein
MSPVSSAAAILVTVVQEGFASEHSIRERDPVLIPAW